MARAAAALHLAGLAAAAVWLRPGSTLAPPEARVAYLARAPLPWTAGWALFFLAALSALALAALLARALRGRAPAAFRLAGVLLVLCAVPLDLVLDVLQVAALPRAAAAGDAAALLAWESSLAFLGLVVANGLYSAGFGALGLALLRAGHRPAAAAGLFTAASGLALAAAGLAEAPLAIALATGPTLVGFSAFALVAARALEAR